MNRKQFFIILLVLIIPLAAGFGLGYGFGFRHSATGGFFSAGGSDIVGTTAAYTPGGNADSADDQISNSRRNAITRSVAMASPAVVGINVTEVLQYTYRDPWSQFFGTDPFFRQFFNDRTVKQEVKSLGSGFIISPDGYILTNDHVAGNAKEITITLTNREKRSAKLVGTDPASDISLLKIEGDHYPFLKLGNSTDVIIGEWVIAMGNPFGLFEISDKPTVTVGVVSATGMNISADGGRMYRDMIQTDASINSGNSGGPLINSVGEVIGVNSVIFTPNQGSIGLGFAIPINRVKRVVEELRKNGKIDRNLWTGLELQSVDMRIARYFGLDRAAGAIVSDIKRNSPGERAGFKAGDIITGVNNEDIQNEDTFNSLLIDAKPGDILHVKVIRDRKTLTLDLKLENHS
jgi:serine protease Do